MMHRAIAFSLLALTALTVAAEAQQKKVKRDRKLITAEEIADAQVNTAYEAVQKLRADWLRRGERPLTVYGGAERTMDSLRGVGVTGGMEDAGAERGLQLVVFIDGNEMGGIEELKRVPSHQVAELRYLSGSDAQQQYGSRYSAGVIQVRLKT